jgi:hypothetical protein
VRAIEHGNRRVAGGGVQRERQHVLAGEEQAVRFIVRYVLQLDTDMV